MNTDMNRTLTDRFDRRIAYLRLSVTSRCNFRCCFCKPDGELDALDQDVSLKLEELIRIARIFTLEGVRKIRLTGGEPLLRRDLPLLIKALSRLEGLKDLGLTTNGYFLAEQIDALAQAGLQRINVSLVSLDAAKFKRITGGGDLGQVMDGLKIALETLSGPVKINVAVRRHLNEEEIADFARLTMHSKYSVRFIEQMPIGAHTPWKREDALPVAAIRRQLQETFGLEPALDGDPYAGPAVRYRIPGACGELGFIGAITEDFCARCNRIRLTYDGKLRPCLLSNQETDLLHPLRNGASDDDLRALIRQVMQSKPERHNVNEADFVRSIRSMYQIGG
ncbi:MAG: GTP 3',8-cyclase MoaA [Candidatus Omnitrophota bacterium]